MVTGLGSIGWWQALIHLIGIDLVSPSQVVNEFGPGVQFKSFSTFKMGKVILV